MRNESPALRALVPLSLQGFARAITLAQRWPPRLMVILMMVHQREAFFNFPGIALRLSGPRVPCPPWPQLGNVIFVAPFFGFGHTQRSH